MLSVARNRPALMTLAGLTLGLGLAIAGPRCSRARCADRRLPLDQPVDYLLRDSACVLAFALVLGVRAAFAVPAKPRRRLDLPPRRSTPGRCTHACRQGTACALIAVAQVERADDRRRRAGCRAPTLAMQVAAMHAATQRDPRGDGHRLLRRHALHPTPTPDGIILKVAAPLRRARRPRLCLAARDDLRGSAPPRRTARRGTWQGMLAATGAATVAGRWLPSAGRRPRRRAIRPRGAAGPVRGEPLVTRRQATPIGSVSEHTLSRGVDPPADDRRAIVASTARWRAITSSG